MAKTKIEFTPFEEKEFRHLGLKRVPINIWDDYYDDNDVPKGEIQETHAYVETEILSTEVKNSALNAFRAAVASRLTNRKVQLSFRERAEGEVVLVFRHLTHKDRLALLKRLRKDKPRYEGLLFDVISES